MGGSLKDRVIESLLHAGGHNSNIMVPPEVILWPDPEQQWQVIIPTLQKELPELLVFGELNKDLRQGPAIWLKCMIGRILPEANWPKGKIPIIYLPGISKQDLKEVSKAGLALQPLVEYQYTGTIWTQENGKEWTILAFIQNEESGLGRKVATDNATKDAIKKSVLEYFADPEVLYGRSVIDADYVLNLAFPDIIPTILRWMCKGDEIFKGMSFEKQQTFKNICKTRYDFAPDHKNIKDIAEKLGSQRNAWKQVWQFYASAPKKYPEIEELLRLAKPKDLGTGFFAFPEESWPQVNEEKEAELRKAISAVAKSPAPEALKKLEALWSEHQPRKQWVWAELGYAPLVNSLPHLIAMSEIVSAAFPSSNIDELKAYYINTGYKADQAMRKALAYLKAEKDKEVVNAVITLLYKPWLETVTQKFQSLIEKDATIFTKQKASEEKESYVLFVDAFRYELAKEFVDRLLKKKFKVDIQAEWSAIPSLTPTAKPNVSPVATQISDSSKIDEFRPELKSGKSLLTGVFRTALEEQGFHFVDNANDINVAQKCWQEIGDIDTKGHQEQAEMVKRIDELFNQIEEVISLAFEKGVKRIKVVTDHGWLLLPGGLPKTQLEKDLTETRWGRCALIKEGAKTNLLHLPWRWNPNIFIAYAPGISFFKKNEEYAHGGISIHECLVPKLLIESVNQSNSQAKIEEIKWVGLSCKITTNGAPDGYFVDIRTKFNDAGSSIVLNKGKSILENKISLLVDDAAESKSAIVVLMDENERILDKKPTLVGA